ncbi:MAG: cyclic nucleotide-binding domain-containing protein [Myxococcota bacterium]|nr:cyclic nucleotide-binding domain-containing protein [Myxococcota bacterium]
MDLRRLKDKATESFSKGKFAKAAELYEAYCAADPKDLQARLRMGDAWAKAGGKTSRDKAIEAYKSAAEGFAKEGFLPRAIAASKLILELDPAHKGVQQMLAGLYASRTGGPSRSPRKTVELPAAGKFAPIDLPPDTGEGVELAPASPVETPRQAPPPPRKVAPPVPRPAALELDGEIDLEAAAREAEQALGSGSAEDGGMDLSMEGDGSPGLELDHSAQLPPELELQLAPQEPPRTPAAMDPGPPGLKSRRGTGEVPVVQLPDLHDEDEFVVELTVKKHAEAPPPEQAPSLELELSAQVAEAAPPPSAFPTARHSRIWLPGAPEVAPAPAPRPELIRPGYTASPTTAETGHKREIERTLAAFSAFDELDLDMISGGEPTYDFPLPAPLPVARPTVPPPAQAAPPPPPRIPTFTELELEGDSLLHAVEMAALAGLTQRGVSSEEQAEDSLADEGQNADSQLQGGLPKIPLFSDLPADAFIELFERCPLKRFGMGERIIDQGSVGDAFYVICGGSVQVVREDQGQSRTLATLPEGSFFGEMALLSGAARTASVDSNHEDTQLLEISATVLAHLSHRYPQVAQALKKFCRQRLLSNVMNTAPLFQPFAKKERKTLIERFRARDVKKGDTIIREGGQTDGLYVLLSGEVEVMKEARVLARLKEGDVFGEMSLLQKGPASATVSATKRTSLLRLPRPDFDDVVKAHPQILALISQLSEDRRRATEAVLGGGAIEGDEGLMLV